MLFSDQEVEMLLFNCIVYKQAVLNTLRVSTFIAASLLLSNTIKAVTCCFDTQEKHLDYDIRKA